MNRTSHVSHARHMIDEPVLQTLQARMGLRIASALSERSTPLPHDITERLRFAREQALAQAQPGRQTASSTTPVSWSAGGSMALGGGVPWWQRALGVLPLVVLVSGLVLIQQWSAREQMMAAADIDAVLLADDLPPRRLQRPRLWRIPANGQSMMVWPSALRCARALLLVVCAAFCGLPVLAQADKAPAKGRAWASLTVQEQQALQPLKKDWEQLEVVSQRKWLEVASRFGKMPTDERLRIQDRMAQWAAMTPAQRASARLQFQEARQLSPGERQAKWQAYQALPDEQRQALAQRAKPDAKPVLAATRSDTAASASGAKNNLVKAQTPLVRAVSPSIVQAKPGATTTTMAIRPSPPAHHQAGLPKIAATPEFVDPATLLPRRGAQAAATVDNTPAVSSDPDKAP